VIPVSRETTFLEATLEAVRGEMEQSRGGVRLKGFGRFENAWVSQGLGAVTDARVARGIRRYISQAFDDEALSRWAAPVHTAALRWGR